MSNFSIVELTNDPLKRSQFALEQEEIELNNLKRRKLKQEYDALAQEMDRQGKDTSTQANESPQKAIPAPECGLKINSPTFAKLMQVIEAFPVQYPDYKTNPPKLNDDVRPWMVKSFGCTKNKEDHVFGRIVKEHFQLKD